MQDSGTGSNTYVGPKINKQMSSETITGRTLYAICAMLKVARLSVLAARHAKNLLDLQIRTDIRAQAVIAAQCLVDDPEAYGGLAILNEIHTLQDTHYLSVLFGLYEQSGSRAGLSRQGIRFMEAALDLAAKDGPASEGVILYSMANAARQVDLKFALSLYIRAKRKKPEYKSISYFIREVAGCLFLLGRYKISREFYEKADLDLSSTFDCLVLGDACLFSDDPMPAIALYDRALLNGDAIIHSEASLKIWLANRLAMRVSNGFTVSTLTRRFNESIEFTRMANHEAALEEFLICCILVPSDHESCINAAICCHNIGNVELYVQLMTVGFSLEGKALLDSFMGEFEKRGFDDSMYDFLSEVYATVKTMAPEAQQHQARMRIEHNFDVTSPIDGSLEIHLR
jgi:tetratricopeptide (TPR) repeat protein